jgi:uncharacterized protein involved in cysteine biosynthesis
VRTARNFAILALIALAALVLPGGGPALNVVVRLVTIAFFTSIAFFGYRLYREHHFTIDTLPDSQRAILYAAAGVVVLTLTATSRLFALHAVGILIWAVLLAACFYGVFWVYTQARGYG